MNRWIRALGALSLVSSSAWGAGAPIQSGGSVTLGTTSSVRDAGLLAEILPPFETATGYRVKVLAVGSGQALQLGRRGEADILILHDPAGEIAFVAAGFGVLRTPLMHNEFLLVGPPGDPAEVGALESVTAAFTQIARSGAIFVSRGDGSGTHVKELSIWDGTGVAQDRTWYSESGQGMGATLQIAHELDAYTLTDIGTYLSHPTSSYLRVFVQGDSLLTNTYHIVLVNPDGFSWINHEAALELRDYLVSQGTQRAIGDFRREEFGRSLFTPAF